MPEIQEINEQINNRLQETELTAQDVIAHVEKVGKEALSEITSKATEIAIEQSGLQGMFKPMQEWEKEKYAGNTKDLQQIITNGPPSAKSLETSKKNRAKSKTPQTTGKGTSVQDSIAKMKEKIVLLEYVDSLKVPEVPTGLSKDGREILLQIGRDQEAVKNRLIQAIQKL